MNVDEDRRGLQVINVFDGSPAERAGIKKGEFITAVNGRSIAGVSSERGHRAHQGPGGHEGAARGGRPRQGRAAHAHACAARGSRCRWWRAGSSSANGKKLGVVELTTFSQGAHGFLRKEIDRLRRRGAEGIVLDLRGNGGGLLREAVLVSSIFIEDGLITYTKGRTKPRRDFEAEGDAIPGDIPVVVLVDRGSASASEIVTGALRDRKRATVVGHAHVRQGRVPGGRAALQRRPARHHRGRVLPAQAARTSARRACGPPCGPPTTPRPTATRRCRSRWTPWPRRPERPD